jgi:hypothetical protein
VDVEVFENAQLVARSITDHDVGPALIWCGNHASKLRRIDRYMSSQWVSSLSHVTCSSLEFYLRQEEFLALLLQGQRGKAVDFAA